MAFSLTSVNPLIQLTTKLLILPKKLEHLELEVLHMIGLILI